MDNRATHFRDWLIATAGYNYLCCAKAITPNQAVRLIASYLDHMARTPWNKHGALRKSDTLQKFVNAAAEFLTRIMTTPFLLERTVSGKVTVDPLITQRLSFYRKWDFVRPKREPYTMEMLETFHSKIVQQEREHALKAFLDLDSLVFDTQALGIFTGSRVSEYAQSGKGKRDTVSRVPARPGAKQTQAPAIAFIASDFEFLSRDGHTLPHAELFSNPNAAQLLIITFRHDKSGRSYTVRKYGRGTDTLCPIRSAIRLLYRAHILEIPAQDPICAYRNPRTPGHKWLLDREVTNTMRKICLETYKDPDHFLHKNVARISSHSNRVTAAVALSQNKMSVEDIAQRLRWKPESVAFYLRESAKDIGTYTANTIAGAQRTFVYTDYTTLPQ
jgi:hypothetical protein